MLLYGNIAVMFIPSFASSGTFRLGCADVAQSFLLGRRSTNEQVLVRRKEIRTSPTRVSLLRPRLGLQVLGS